MGVNINLAKFKARRELKSTIKFPKEIFKG